jgi:8-oxo-dGTP pyrophosphatase MutT (NUDIX family)
VEESSPRLLSFEPNRQPTSPRDAATVVVIRDGERGVEVFCVLRHPNSGFLGGAVVFPGGKVDGADGAEGWVDRASLPHPRTEAFAGPGATARALGVAACRETLEEAGIVPLEAPGLPRAEVEALRAELANGKGGLLAGLDRRRARLAIGALVPFARWVTPEAESRRFDARFFLLEAPPGQEGRHDDHETTESFWSAPAEVLARSARGQIFLAPPTMRALELLAEAGTVARALALAAEQSLAPICPTFIPGDPPYLALPGDPSHEVPRRRVSGPTRFVLRDGRFVSEDAPAQARTGAPDEGAQARTEGEQVTEGSPS